MRPGRQPTHADSLNPSLIVGVDVSEIALSLAASNIPESARLVRADISRGLPVDDGAFDVATIFGVLCHQWVESEATVLAETARILRPGGLVLLTEPAFDAMTREIHDITLTKRRYRHADFDAWFASAGFETLFSSYFTSFGFPIILAAKRFMREAGWRGGTSGYASHPWIYKRNTPGRRDARSVGHWSRHSNAFRDDACAR